MWRGCALIGWSGGRFCSWSSKNTIFPLLPPSKPYYYFSPTGGEKRGKETDKSSLGLKEKQKDWKHFIIQWHFHIMSKLRLWIIRDMLRLCAAVRSIRHPAAPPPPGREECGVRLKKTVWFVDSCSWSHYQYLHPSPWFIWQRIKKLNVGDIKIYVLFRKQDDI